MLQVSNRSWAISTYAVMVAALCVLGCTTAYAQNYEPLTLPEFESPLSSAPTDLPSPAAVAPMEPVRPLDLIPAPGRANQVSPPNSQPLQIPSTPALDRLNSDLVSPLSTPQPAQAQPAQAQPAQLQPVQPLQTQAAPVAQPTLAQPTPAQPTLTQPTAQPVQINPTLGTPEPQVQREPEYVAQVPPAVDPNSLSKLVPLRNTNSRVIRERVGALYQGRLVSQFVPGTRVESMSVPTAVGRKLTLQIDAAKNSVVLQGDPKSVQAWERMIGFLDRPSANLGERSDVMPIAKSKQATVDRMADILQNLAGRPNPTPRPPADIVQWNRNKTRILAQAPQPGAQPRPGNPPALPQPGGQGEPAPYEPPGLTGPVVIQNVPGMDALLLRGAPSDVAKVRQLIDDIEKLSVVTEPTIVVVNLENVDSESMAGVIQPLQEEILSPRQGQVSITPLIKPNSILLIGRLQGVKVVQDLIDKLDRPVDPEKEFHVFRLENLSALEAEQAIEQFYQAEGEDGGRPGLGAKVNVVADFRTNSLIVQANPRDAEELRQLLKRIDVAEAAAKDEVRVFNLENTISTDIAPLLQQVLSGEATGQDLGGQGGGNQGDGGTDTSQGRSATLSLQTVDRRGQRVYESGILTDVEVVANVPGNTLIVRGPKDSMPLIAELIRQLDELPAEDAEVKVFTIVNGDATQLATLLQTLFGTGTQGNQGGQNQGGANATGTTGGAINPLIPLVFSVDARTNSIVATGSVPDLRVVEAILLRLDEGNDQQDRKTETFRLRYAFAQDVATAINTFLDGRRNLQQLAPTTVPQLALVDREIIIVPEPVSNTLLVSATPEYFEEIYRIVREMDAQPPMVAIQMLIARVDLDRFYELGVEIGIQDPLLFDRGTGFNFNNGGPLPDGTDAASLATAGLLGAQGLSNFGVGRTNGTLGFGGLVLSAGNDAINLLVRALQEDSRLQVLSRPQITTLDNQPAVVEVGQQVPFVQGTTLTNFGGTTSNVSLIPVGIILGVTPRVTPDGLVVMEVDVTSSTLGLVSDGIPIAVGAGGEVINQPILDSTSARSTISARSGQTVVIGGLITESESESHSGVPYLSDIPLIGDLFRFDQDTTNRSELVLIMTPYLIRDDDDLRCFNEMETSRMSWCLNDAYRVHGMGDACPGKWPTAYGNETQPLTIYPDRNPSAGPQRSTPYSPLSSRVGNVGDMQYSNAFGGVGNMGVGVPQAAFGGGGGAGNVMTSPLQGRIPPNAQVLSDRALYPSNAALGNAAQLNPGLNPTRAALPTPALGRPGVSFGSPAGIPGVPGSISGPSLPSAGAIPQLLNATP